MNELAPQYTNGGYDGVYKECHIYINRTLSGFQVRVYGGKGEFIASTYTATMQQAHKFAEEIIDEVGEVKS